MPRFAILLAFAFCATTLVLADDWPSWRGPQGNGHSRETNLPTRWDAKSIVWKTALPGVGQSSPIVWQERVFLTSALEQGKKRIVLCVDRTTGKIVWQQEAWAGAPEPSHKMNGWASSTCATDGERVVAFFGKGGLHCYSMDGKKLWSRDLGEFAGPWGTSACPIFVGDLVVQNCDSIKDPYILAVDKRTGKDVWKTPRPTPFRGGWSTPVLVDGAKRQELVLNGEDFLISYQPQSGKELWRCKTFKGRGEPTVAPGKDKVFVVNGLAGDIYSVKLGGSGDVTASHMAWHTPRKGGRDQPSPILVDNFLVVGDMTGLVTCYDSASGKILWKERLLEDVYSASPIAANGLVYFLSENGNTSVLEPGNQFKLVAENSLNASGEIFRASLTPSEGQIFARSHSHLFCIAGKK